MSSAGSNSRNPDGCVRARKGSTVVDFAAMLKTSEQEAPVEPRELYGQLKKAAGYGYLRDV